MPTFPPPQVKHSLAGQAELLGPNSNSNGISLNNLISWVLIRSLWPLGREQIEGQPWDEGEQESSC